jgi:hypothetical protein
MAHWKTHFPSQFLQVSDLTATPIIATIESVTTEEFSNNDKPERKPVLNFAEPEIKSCVLNLTRAEAVEEIAGSPDTDEWIGRQVGLVLGSTRYGGKKVACICIVAAANTDCKAAE